LNSIFVNDLEKIEKALRNLLKFCSHVIKKIEFVRSLENAECKYARYKLSQSLIKSINERDIKWKEIIIIFRIHEICFQFVNHFHFDQQVKEEEFSMKHAIRHDR
jgi:hypothetical protein